MAAVMDTRPASAFAQQDATAADVSVVSRLYGSDALRLSESVPSRATSGEPGLPIACKHSSPPRPDALCRTDAMPRGGEFRHSEVGIILVTRAGSANDQSTPVLRRIAAGQAAHRERRLEVLFCTWQT